LAPYFQELYVNESNLSGVDGITVAMMAKPNGLNAAYLFLLHRGLENFIK